MTDEVCDLAILDGKPGGHAAAISGNLCRRTGSCQITRAIGTAAGEVEA